MKSEVKKIESKMPRLMICPLGQIILATGVNEENDCFKGVIVNNTLYNPIGYYSENWTKEFSDFKGSITLSND